jgi:hypothetical protein
MRLPPPDFTPYRINCWDEHSLTIPFLPHLDGFDSHTTIGTFAPGRIPLILGYNVISFKHHSHVKE